MIGSRLQILREGGSKEFEFLIEEAAIQNGKEER